MFKKKIDERKMIQRPVNVVKSRKISVAAETMITMWFY